jgi:hypothetical protein
VQVQRGGPGRGAGFRVPAQQDFRAVLGHCVEIGDDDVVGRGLERGGLRHHRLQRDAAALDVAGCGLRDAGHRRQDRAELGIDGERHGGVCSLGGIR